jgi:hypothetical protein
MSDEAGPEEWSGGEEGVSLGKWVAIAIWENEMCLDAERHFSSNLAPRESVGHGNGCRFGEARFGPRRGFAQARDHVSVGNYPASSGWG